MTNTPRCDRTDCFAIFGSRCRALTEAISDKPCPFFQTDAEVKRGREKAIERLNSMGLGNLVLQYTANARGYAL